MQSASFIRKLIYIGIIGLLLIPISLVSLPSARNRQGEVASAGGYISRLREDYELSQAKLSEIDPASEAMKLASLGLRGVAVNVLWMQALEHKRKDNFDQLEATLGTLIKMQPNFIKVWEFQAHNLSYNVSAEFDDYEYRYHWVKKGIMFLTEGIRYNSRDHRMTDNLGWFTGAKIGTSDERRQFRRMFRLDNDFHQKLASYIEPDLYDTPEYGHDNWKMAYYWYDRSRNMVEREQAKQYISDWRFYQLRPSQLRNQAMSLQKEFRTDEIIKEIWASAARGWLEFGRQKLRNTLGVTFTLDGNVEAAQRLERAREQLDEFAPGVRAEIEQAIRQQMNFTQSQRDLLDKPVDQRTDMEILEAQSLERELFQAYQRIDIGVFERIPSENRAEARRVMDVIASTMSEIYTIEQNQDTANYRYWVSRNQAESEDLTVAAQQKLYDADELRRRSVFDDEMEVDLESGERRVLTPGAISTYERSYSDWQQVMEQYPNLVLGSLGDDIVDHILKYRQMLQVTQIPWPLDFPLQRFIDVRHFNEENDKLPTSEDLAEERALRAAESNSPEK
ncbi:MAG TPA: hypothetical protein PKD54_11200 [Pirellulaceae bacterium]|nr:hypothetical protein [Pirellulaceae bacterium]